MTKEEFQQCGRVGNAKSRQSKSKKKSMRDTLEVLLKMLVDKGKCCEIEEIRNFV